MPREDFYILKEHTTTADLVSLDLSKCPESLINDITALVSEHLRKLRNNCMAPYNGIQKARERIANIAADIRNILK